MVLALPVTDWLIVFSAPHQTSEIPDYGKKILEISSSLTLGLALLNADWFPELHASRSSGSSQCPDREELRNSFPVSCSPTPKKCHDLQGWVSSQPALTASGRFQQHARTHLLKYGHCRCCTSQFVGNPLYDTVLLILVMIFKSGAWAKIYSFLKNSKETSALRPIVFLSAHPSLSFPC